MAQRRGLLALALLFAFVLVGCVPAVHIALDPNVVPLLAKVDCKNVVIEDDVSVAINVSTGGSEWIGGCLGAMIDNSENKARSRKAEELVQPLLAQTSDVDIRGQLGKALEFTLQDIGWLNVNAVQSTAAVPHPDELKAITRPMLHLSTSYKLVPKCYSLDITTMAKIWLPNENKAVFMGFYTYYSDPIGDIVDDAAVAAWAADGAAAYRSAVTEGVAEVAKMLRSDLPPDGHLPTIKDGEWTKIKFLDPSTNSRKNWKCTVLSESDRRLIFRFENGNVWSIPKALIDMEALKSPARERAAKSGNADGDI